MQIYFVYLRLWIGAVSTLAGLTSANPGASDGVGTAASFNNPLGICLDSVGNLIVADRSNNKIRKIDSAGTLFLPVLIQIMSSYF